MASAPALRVASRVSGIRNGRSTQGSTAKMELAKLVGPGRNAAALRHKIADGGARSRFGGPSLWR